MLNDVRSLMGRDVDHGFAHRGDVGVGRLTCATPWVPVYLTVTYIKKHFCIIYNLATNSWNC